MLINKIEQQSLQRKLNPLKFILKLEHKQLVSWQMVIYSIMTAFI